MDATIMHYSDFKGWRQGHSDEQAVACGVTGKGRRMTPDPDHVTCLQCKAKLAETPELIAPAFIRPPKRERARANTPPGPGPASGVPGPTMTTPVDPATLPPFPKLEEPAAPTSTPAPAPEGGSDVQP